MKTEFLSLDGQIYRGILFRRGKEQAAEVATFFDTYVLSEYAHLVSWSCQASTGTLALEYQTTVDEGIEACKAYVPENSWLLVGIMRYSMDEWKIVPDTRLDTIDFGCSGNLTELGTGKEEHYVTWDGMAEHVSQFAKALLDQETDQNSTWSTEIPKNLKDYLAVRRTCKDSKNPRTEHYCLFPGDSIVIGLDPYGRRQCQVCTPEFILTNYTLFQVVTSYDSLVQICRERLSLAGINFNPIGREALDKITNLNSELIARGDYIFEKIRECGCCEPGAVSESIRLDEDSIIVTYSNDPFYDIPNYRTLSIPITSVTTFEDMLKFINDFKKKNS